ncbi:carbon-nitrogen hydrolase family protein [Actinopolymorpha alba]|uniref:carbon-nitrogen hydrolase family protein n=1 Tax=Actinopolymorpha alba TaxID=533267 RepID=UPI0003700A64|nr:carbon-nitrogen hydrolase family protein [Actinopolymorpha alba]
MTSAPSGPSAPSATSGPSTPFLVATAQNAISPDVRQNGRGIRELMRAADQEGARLIHFPEGALSGYAKAQVKDWQTVDWPAINEELEQIAALAKELRLWTVLGSAHRLTAPHRPHNSLYVISDRGILVDRYDKRYCSHTEITHWYTPGFRPVAFEVDGFRFGTALCIEINFPEHFAEYERLAVDCVLFSSYSEDPMFGVLAQAHASTNKYWLSFSVPAQCSHAVPASLISPAGGYLTRAPESGRPSLVLGRLDRADPEFEGHLTFARTWRASARAGDIYAARKVDDPRSVDTQRF